MENIVWDIKVLVVDTVENFLKDGNDNTTAYNKGLLQAGQLGFRQCRSFIYLWCIRTGNGFDSPRQ
jgi:hypothetical protein